MVSGGYNKFVSPIGGVRNQGVGHVKNQAWGEEEKKLGGGAISRLKTIGESTIGRVGVFMANVTESRAPHGRLGVTGGRNVEKKSDAKGQRGDSSGAVWGILEPKTETKVLAGNKVLGYAQTLEESKFLLFCFFFFLFHANGGVGMER